MAVRYAAAATAGYVVFLLLIRAWVLWKARQVSSPVSDAPVARAHAGSGGGVDLGDIGDLHMGLPTRGGSGAGQTAIDAFGGGRSGGAGASMFVGPPPAPPVTAASVGGRHSSGGGWAPDLDIDGDDLFWLIVALLAVFAGLIAIVYIVWTAPAFLGEAALNAAVAGKVYQGMRRRPSTHWTSDQLGRTILPATIVIVTAALAGYALHRAAPHAVSIGGVVDHFTGIAP